MGKQNRKLNPSVAHPFAMLLFFAGETSMNLQKSSAILNVRAPVSCHCWRGRHPPFNLNAISLKWYTFCQTSD